MTRVLFIFLLLPLQYIALAQNLIINPGAELDPPTNGWTILSGPVLNPWARGTEVSPHSGTYHFYAGNDSPDGSELYQDVDVSSFASSIDAGASTFNFSTWMRVYNFSSGAYNDIGRAYVEYRDASSTVLSTYDTGPKSTLSWIQYSDSRVAPAGTRTIRIRLVAYKQRGTAADGYFDDLVLTHTSSALPVSLVSFTSTFEENNIDIQWQTSTEESNDYFTLEKSTDGVTWETLSVQQGLLQSNQLSTYQFEDAQLVEGVQYYRLTQTDVDGASTTFPIIAQKISPTPTLHFSFYPNPSDGVVTINTTATGEKRLRLFSIEGQALQEVSFETNEYSIDLTNFPSGQYVIELVSQMSAQRKILIKY